MVDQRMKRIDDIQGGAKLLAPYTLRSTNNNCDHELPIYFVVSLGCYGVLMVGVGLMNFPTCSQEAILLQKDIVEAKEYLKQQGVYLTLD
ncbi:hypothetical protein VNO80_10020 [Phaseolus coccineus]|uniref:Dolichol-phosphate mannosyltransferase subunit 3 n=1 Tax=Phaseolus coccineus TaxID=3886 RepID=A0AAN9RJ21_PHACN